MAGTVVGLNRDGEHKDKEQDRGTTMKPALDGFRV
jgi:hypothetical protein